MNLATLSGKRLGSRLNIISSMSVAIFSVMMYNYTQTKRTTQLTRYKLKRKMSIFSCVVKKKSRTVSTSSKRARSLMIP